jgi:hypothetical protein
MSLLEILKIGLPLAFGWFVVHRLSAARDMDKARREMVAKAADNLVENATSIFFAAKKYHANERDIEAEQRLKMDLQDMSIRAHELSNVVDDPSNLKVCSTSIADLRKAITRRHFEDEHTAILDVNDQQMAEIADAYLRVKRSLFSLKIGQFPKRAAFF